MNYYEKLKDPRWQKKRLEILDRDRFTCQNCLSEENTLHVHHIAYVGSNPWETPNKLLQTLCEKCHNDEEKSLKISEKNLIKTLRESGYGAWNIDQVSFLIRVFEEKNSERLPLGIVRWFLSDTENIQFIKELHQENEEKLGFKF